MNYRESQRDKFRGSLVGLAIGDALGAPVESLTASEIRGKYPDLIDGFMDHHKKRTLAGQWTDNTLFSLATARGIIKNPNDWLTGVEDEYLGLLHTHLNDVGRFCGRTTEQALWRLEGYRQDDVPRVERRLLPGGAGNGPAMRIAPLALFFAARSYKDVEDGLIDCCRITHTSKLSVITGIVHAKIIMQIISENRDWLLSDDFVHAYVFWDNLKLDTEELENRLDSEKIVSPKIKTAFRRGIFVSDTLLYEKIGNGFFAHESCVFAWAIAFKYARDFKKAVITAVNYGGDADTTASMVGAILGALHGLEAIKKTGWCEGLWQYDEIVETADKLFEVSVK